MNKKACKHSWFGPFKSFFGGAYVWCSRCLKQETWHPSIESGVHESGKRQ